MVRARLALGLVLVLTPALAAWPTTAAARVHRPRGEPEYHYFHLFLDAHTDNPFSTPCNGEGAKQSWPYEGFSEPTCRGTYDTATTTSPFSNNSQGTAHWTVHPDRSLDITFSVTNTHYALTGTMSGGGSDRLTITGGDAPWPRDGGITSGSDPNIGAGEKGGPLRIGVHSPGHGNGYTFDVRGYLIYHSTAPPPEIPPKLFCHPFGVFLEANTPLPTNHLDHLICTATGSPVPTLSVSSGALPEGVSFQWGTASERQIEICSTFAQHPPCSFAYLTGRTPNIDGRSDPKARGAFTVEASNPRGHERLRVPYCLFLRREESFCRPIRPQGGYG